ncbi:MAG TPA: TIGR00153 family protein [Methanobacterium sp.]|nr:TIGR00153 family protein [Methanobacterium sp.]
MVKLFRKESQVEKYAEVHVKIVFDSILKLKEVMSSFYIGDFAELDKKVDELSKLEHKADDVRRKMELEFYNGAFLPFDREDRIVMAELVDSVSDMAESTGFSICLSRLKFPSKGQGDFEKFVDIIIDTVSVLRECIDQLDIDMGNSITKAHEVEDLEDKADIMERKIIKTLYQLYDEEKIDILTLIELKNITTKLGNIVDRAENASDRALIIAAKRRG